MRTTERKTIRLPGSEYEAGWFFVTICTEKRRNILATIKPISVGADDSVRPCDASQGFECSLTDIGAVVEDCLKRLTNKNAGIFVDKYIIMPNHIHVIICLNDEMGGQSRPPLQQLIQGFKSISTRKCWPFGERKIWQRSFYDHVIRGEEDYLRVWRYIDENPAKWAEDAYYVSA